MLFVSVGFVCHVLFVAQSVFAGVFLETCFAELCLLLIDVPLLTRSDQRG